MAKLSFIEAVNMIVVLELMIAGAAGWVHDTWGGVAALVFVMGGIAVWLNLLPDIVDASEEI